MPVGWVARKLDSLGGAVVAAVGGGGASQWREYLQQYLQRLGGHADEAQSNLAHLRELYDLAEPAEQAVLAEMMARADALVESLDALQTADPWMQPVVFLRHMDPAIARATLEAFQPALPLDPASLLWAGVGMILALLVYELVKETLWAPVGIAKGVARRRRRRQPRERVEPSL